MPAFGWSSTWRAARDAKVDVSPSHCQLTPKRASPRAVGPIAIRPIRGCGTCYVNGKVQYERLSQTYEFDRGIERLLEGTRTEQIAIMCSEAEPLECHRTVLIAQVLADRGVAIDHIHRDGRVESHGMAMHRLMARFGLRQADLFHSPAELLREALIRQEHRIAYVNPELCADDTAWR